MAKIALAHRRVHACIGWEFSMTGPPLRRSDLGDAAATKDPVILVKHRHLAARDSTHRGVEEDAQTTSAGAGVALSPQ